MAHAHLVHLPARVEACTEHGNGNFRIFLSFPLIIVYCLAPSAFQTLTCLPTLHVLCCIPSRLARLPRTNSAGSGVEWSVGPAVKSQWTPPNRKWPEWQGSDVVTGGF
jgi:hypothetical protein